MLYLVLQNCTFLSATLCGGVLWELQSSDRDRPQLVRLFCIVCLLCLYPLDALF